jgi:hypothetical protein
MAAAITCTRCLTTGEPRMVPRGSGWGTLALIVLGPLLVWGVVTLARAPQGGVASPPTTEDDLSTPHPGMGFGDVGVALLFAIGPALGYQFWRIGARVPRCAACNSDDVVPSDSPRALEISSRAKATLVEE